MPASLANVMCAPAMAFKAGARSSFSGKAFNPAPLRVARREISAVCRAAVRNPPLPLNHHP